MQPPWFIVANTESLRQAYMTKKDKDKDETDPETSRVMARMAHLRDKKLSKARKKEIASQAAKARWAKWRKEHGL